MRAAVVAVCAGRRYSDSLRDRSTLRATRINNEIRASVVDNTSYRGSKFQMIICMIVSVQLAVTSCRHDNNF